MVGDPLSLREERWPKQSAGRYVAVQRRQAWAMPLPSLACCDRLCPGRRRAFGAAGRRRGGTQQCWVRLALPTPLASCHVQKRCIAFASDIFLARVRKTAPQPPCLCCRLPPTNASMQHEDAHGAAWRPLLLNPCGGEPARQGGACPTQWARLPGAAGWPLIHCPTQWARLLQQARQLRLRQGLLFGRWAPAHLARPAH